MAWWYKDRESDKWTAAEGLIASAVVAEGRAHYRDGRPFQIAQGTALGAWPNLFEGGADLADFIDDRHEDQRDEERFTVEAGISDAELETLCAQLNAVWGRFVDRRRPCGNRLDLGPPQTVAATEAWLDAQDAKTAKGGEE